MVFSGFIVNLQLSCRLRRLHKCIRIFSTALKIEDGVCDETKNRNFLATCLLLSSPQIWYFPYRKGICPEFCLRKTTARITGTSIENIIEVVSQLSWLRNFVRVLFAEFQRFACEMIPISTANAQVTTSALV
jgi:hypothetical protein